MKRILVLYATREGQTRRIAEHIGMSLWCRGYDADIYNAAALPKGFTLGTYATAIVAGSVHFGRHEPEIVAFAKEHRGDLEQQRAVFISVSGSEATAEDQMATPAVRARSAANVKKAVDDFIAATGWNPQRVFPVAGALRYLQYNWIIQFVIRLIARRSGASIDTSRNTEYTNWEALDRFTTEWVAEVEDAETVCRA